MIASETVATLGTRSTISGWAAISPSRKSSRFARHRVHRHPDYPASLGLDRAALDGTGAAVRYRDYSPTAPTLTLLVREVSSTGLRMSSRRASSASLVVQRSAFPCPSGIRITSFTAASSSRYFLVLVVG